MKMSLHLHSIIYMNILQKQKAKKKTKKKAKASQCKFVWWLDLLHLNINFISSLWLNPVNIPHLDLIGSPH